MDCVLCRGSLGLSSSLLLSKSPQNPYTVKKIDEVVRHPHLVTQDQFSLVSEKVSGIPKGNFTINIEPFRQTFTYVELLRQNWIVSKGTPPGRELTYSGLNSDTLPLRHTLFFGSLDNEGSKVAAELYLCSQMSHRAQSYENG